MRSAIAIQSHQNTGLRPIGFSLIDALVIIRSFGACISSSITTVIHVRYQDQVNNSCYNEPFAVSPFRLFELRHAWLSLWEKHITADRINRGNVSMFTTFTLQQQSQVKGTCTIHYFQRLKGVTSPITANGILSHCYYKLLHIPLFTGCNSSVHSLQIAKAIIANKLRQQRRMIKQPYNCTMHRLNSAKEKFAKAIQQLLYPQTSNITNFITKHD